MGSDLKFKFIIFGLALVQLEHFQNNFKHANNNLIQIISETQSNIK